ncbi:hypothetical protein BDY19DRAFT_882381 [Irpex rosettiformis]|uniref:Uncharacterized protein n=1 Tax=Irpex rosettiformis TaxID=378272 RepID=A0ACB8UHE1_9APHY|nr:hypothetical protein BDY19DRAFT_882381 [Irpex rosettiformis]
MHALRTPSFFRPMSRPASPAPPITRTDPVVMTERLPRPMSKLSFSNFKRTASPLIQSAPALVHDGSYMEALSLRLSEAISKALAQPVGPGNPGEMLGGRRAIPAGRGCALGDLIATEINSARDDPHLYRAVIRTLHRPLSVLVTNVSTQLIPLIASPAFLAPAVPTPHSPNPNPTQMHALGLATFAGELLDTFDEFGLGLDNDMRGDGLKVVRDSLLSTIKRVVDPLVNALKNDLLPHIEGLEQPSSVVAKTTGATKVSAAHPCIVYLTSVMPIYAKALGRYITCAAAQSILATLVISLLWRGLVALSNRPIPPASLTPPGSPPVANKALKDMKRRSSSGTPPTTPPASRFTLKLPPSRPPSPPTTTGRSSHGGDAKALYDLLAMLPRPTDSLAREAVDDGYDSLSALVALFEFIQSSKTGTSAIFDLPAELQALTHDIPVLIALPVMLPALFPSTSQGQTQERTVANMLGMSDAAYRNGCLSGFGRAEECVPAVGQRVLDVLGACEGNAQGKGVVIRWLKAEVAEAIVEQQQQH